MRVVQVWGRGAAVAFLLSVVSSVASAAPFQMAGHTPASRGWLGSPAVDVPDPCAEDVLMCRPGRVGELAETPARSLFETFAAQLGEATSPTTDAVALPTGNSAAWALYAGSIAGGGTHVRLALTSAAADPTRDATLFEDVSVLVQQVPEPSLLVSVLIGLLGWRVRRGPAA